MLNVGEPLIVNEDGLLPSVCVLLCKMSDDNDTSSGPRHHIIPRRQPPPHPGKRQYLSFEEENVLALSKPSSSLSMTEQNLPCKPVVTYSLSSPMILGAVAVDKSVTTPSCSIPQAMNSQQKDVSMNLVSRMLEEIAMITFALNKIPSEYGKMRSRSLERPSNYTQNHSSSKECVSSHNINIRKWVRCLSSSDLYQKGQWYR